MSDIMNNRFLQFQKAFPLNEITQKVWSETKVWELRSPTAIHLKMDIFPDTITDIDMSHGIINKVTFAKTQTELTNIKFFHNHLTVCELLPEMKKVKRLDLAGNPLIKHKLGGSLETLEVLLLPLRSPKCLVTMSSGMKSLKILEVGSHVGTVRLPPGMVKLELLTVDLSTGVVKLPKDATNLQFISVMVSEEGKVIIPKTYTKLKELSVHGKVAGLVVNPLCAKLERLRFCTTVKGNYHSPNLPNLKSILVALEDTSGYTITKAAGTNLEAISFKTHQPFFGDPSVEDSPVSTFTLPSSLPKLKDIDISGGFPPVLEDRMSVVIPKDAVNIVSATFNSVNVVIKPTLYNLDGIRCFGSTMKFMEAETISDKCGLSMKPLDAVTWKPSKYYLDLIANRSEVEVNSSFLTNYKPDNGKASPLPKFPIHRFARQHL